MAALHCLSCEHANSAAAKYCEQCGSALNLRLCEKCEAINERNALRCHSCAAPLAPPRAGRKPRVMLALASAGALGVVCAGGLLYLLDRTRLEAAQVRVAPVAPAPAERIEVVTPAPEPAGKGKAAVRSITHTRAVLEPAPAPAAPPAAASAAPPMPAFENTASPVTHTRRAVVTPDTKSGSD